LSWIFVASFPGKKWWMTSTSSNAGRTFRRTSFRAEDLHLRHLCLAAGLSCHLLAFTSHSDYVTMWITIVISIMMLIILLLLLFLGLMWYILLLLVVLFVLLALYI
jgi:hypothetical protein